jgi:hypothetical protein
MAAVAGDAAWFGGATREAEPGCERRERRILADVRSMSARTIKLTGCRKRSCRQFGAAPGSAVVGSFMFHSCRLLYLRKKLVGFGRSAEHKNLQVLVLIFLQKA